MYLPPSIAGGTQTKTCTLKPFHLPLLQALFQAVDALGVQEYGNNDNFMAEKVLDEE
jgi:hypothetical protein